MRNQRKRLVTILLLTFFPGPFVQHSLAQEAASEEPIVPFWFIASAGWATPPGVGGGGAMSLNFGHQPAFQLGVSVNQRFSLLGSPPLTAALSTGIGMRLHFDRLSQSAFFVGPALVFAERLQSPAGRRDAFTGGVVGSVQVFFKPLAVMGFGLEAYGNLNPARSYAGIRVGMLAGNKR